MRLRKRAYSGPAEPSGCSLEERRPDSRKQIGGGHPLQAVAQRIERIGSIADAELRDGFRGQAAPGKVFARPGALRRTQLLFKPGCRQLMQFEQFAALAVLLRLFRGGKFPLGQGMPHFWATILTASVKPTFSIFCTKEKTSPALVAAEAMVELAHRMHGEGRGLFPVKRTQSGVVLPSGFFQRDVFADDADDVRLLLYELGKV